MASQSAYGSNPNAGINVNADHGWGGYQWPGGVPSNLLGTTDYQQVNGAKQRIRVTVRRELVPLFTLAFAIADRDGEVWGPWSYENRPIGGTSTSSNHSRAKAIDVNAPSNPQSYTFQSDLPPGLVADWERIGLCWGGRYGGGTKFDTMHFEYGYSPADVAGHVALAQQLLPAEPGKPNPPEDDMPYSEADLKRIIGEVVDQKITGALKAIDGVLRDTYNRADWVNTRAEAIDPVLRETFNRADWVNGKTDKIVALLQGTPVTPTYTVVAGDTLGAIAKKFGVTVDDLVQWNGITDPNNISVGQVLKVGKA